MTLLNSVHKELLRAGLFREVAIDVSLTDGTREYQPSGLTTSLRINSAYYVTSATERHRISPVTVQELDDNHPTWRQDTDEGTPQLYYWRMPSSSDSSTPYVGFWPIPDTTTSTYPKVTLYVSQATVLETTDELPVGMLSNEVYLYGMAWRWATRRDREMEAFYRGLYNEALAKETRHLAEVTGIHQKIMPGWLTKGVSR